MSPKVIIMYCSVNFLSLAEFSDKMLSEVERLLVEGTKPEHPFWSVDSNFFDPEIVEERRRLGVDVESEKEIYKSEYRKCFDEVAHLIRFRLERAAEPRL